MISRLASLPLVRGFTLTIALASVAGFGVALGGILLSQARMAWFSELSRASQLHLSSMKDLETSYRGFLIVPSADFLTPLRQAEEKFPQQQAELRLAAQKTGEGVAESEQLIAASAEMRSYASRLLAARETSFEAAQSIVSRREGKRIMDLARETAGSIDRLARDRSGELQARVWDVHIPLAVISGIAMLASSLLLGLFAWNARRMSIRARELLGKVMERAPVGIALLDNRRRTASMNAAFGRMIPKTIRDDAMLSQVSPVLARHVDRILGGAADGRAQNKEEAAETVFDADFGEGPKAFKFEVFPVMLANGEGRAQRGAGIVLADITPQREWEAQLQAARDQAEGANRAKSAFIANMSHELRTPLTAVLGYCELIEEDLKEVGQKQLLSDLNKISINARHLLGLINDVLDLSKIEARRMEVHAVEFTASALLKEIEAATGSLVAKKDNRLALLCESDFTLHTDDLKLKQILINLVGNAAKFTERGDIAVTARLSGSDAEFEVRDTGIGMTGEQLSGLFQRFVQADGTTTRKYGGSGLGLALTRALVIMLGGSIEVESEEGRGSVFKVRLPSTYQQRAVEIAPLDDMPEPAAPREESAGSPVLVVDDDPSARDLLTRHLTSEGFPVLTAATGPEALELLKQHRPVAVLLDVMMPGMDGWHVLKAIRSNPETEKIPVIMQTVLDDTRVAYALGANSYLKKPIRRAELAEALLSAVQAQGERRVLVVDDDAEASRRLKVLLQRDGWSVDLAEEGGQALDLLRANSYALVLADLVMPGMDGHALVRAIRRAPEFDGIPIVVMTAQDINSAAVRKLKSKTAGIVQKGSMPLFDLVADLRGITDAAAAAQSQSQGAE